MSPFVVALGVVILVILGLVIVTVVGVPVAALASFVAGLTGHPPGRPQTRPGWPVGNVRAPIPEPLRRAVLERDNWQCVYCGAHGRGAMLQFDHIIPLSKGGATTLENLEILCQRCNLRKGVS